MRRVVLVPAVLALSGRYASIEDPVAELRTAVSQALAWVGPAPRLVGDRRGVIEELLGSADADADADADAEVSASSTSPDPGSDGEATHGLVIVANGSAKRTDKAPGHYDERALAFDDWLREALTVEPGDLAKLDRELAAELWADVDALAELGEVLTGPAPSDFAPAETDRGPGRPQVRLIAVDYDDDPYGVKYWVIRWEVG